MKITFPNNLYLLAIYLLCCATVITRASVLRNYHQKQSNGSINISTKTYRLPLWSRVNFRQLLSPWTLPVIRHINLYRNQYWNFDVSPLTVLPIEFFVMRQNEIVDMDNCFIYFKELRFLDFRDNRINRFIVSENPPELVSSKLATIWLQNNSIISVPDITSFLNLTLDSMQLVNLTDNPFSCSCRDNQWIVDSPALWGRIFQGECKSPPLMIGQPINICVNLNTNTIRSGNGTEIPIPRSMLSRVMDNLHFW